MSKEKPETPIIEAYDVGLVVGKDSTISLGDIALTEDELAERIRRLDLETSDPIISLADVDVLLSNKSAYADVVPTSGHSRPVLASGFLSQVQSSGSADSIHLTTDKNVLAFIQGTQAQPEDGAIQRVAIPLNASSSILFTNSNPSFFLVLPDPAVTPSLRPFDEFTLFLSAKNSNPLLGTIHLSVSLPEGSFAEKSIKAPLRTQAGLSYSVSAGAIIIKASVINQQWHLEALDPVSVIGNGSATLIYHYNGCDRTTQEDIVVTFDPEKPLELRTDIFDTLFNKFSRIGWYDQYEERKFLDALGATIPPNTYKPDDVVTLVPCWTRDCFDMDNEFSGHYEDWLFPIHTVTSDTDTSATYDAVALAQTLVSKVSTAAYTASSVRAKLFTDWTTRMYQAHVYLQYPDGTLTNIAHGTPYTRIAGSSNDYRFYAYRENLTNVTAIARGYNGANNLSTRIEVLYLTEPVTKTPKRLLEASADNPVYVMSDKSYKEVLYVAWDYEKQLRSQTVSQHIFELCPDMYLCFGARDIIVHWRLSGTVNGGSGTTNTVVSLYMDSTPPNPMTDTTNNGTLLASKTNGWWTHESGKSGNQGAVTGTASVNEASVFAISASGNRNYSARVYIDYWYPVW